MKRVLMKILLFGGICILLSDFYTIIIKQATFTMYGFITFLLVGFGVVYLAGALEDDK